MIHGSAPTSSRQGNTMSRRDVTARTVRRRADSQRTRGTGRPLPLEPPPTDDHVPNSGAAMRKLGPFGKAVVALSAGGLVATTAAACSSSKSDTKPVAEIKSIPGGTTSVKLDTGFANALTSLKVAPGIVGTAKL